MPKPKPHFIPQPRPWNEFQVAARLNRGVEWLRKHRSALEQEGFPRKDPLLDGWDSKAIEEWLDRRSGLEASPAINAEAQALEAIRRARTT
jgi:hypothetical protein